MIRDISRGTTVYMGFSTDTKPARHQTAGGDYEEELENMSIFIEADTGDRYFYDADTHAWTEYGSAGE